MQEPRAAFNPALTLHRSVLESAGNAPHCDRLARLCDALELPLSLLNRRPAQVSIGQAQRTGIVRALMGGSPLILFDEPLSALDAVTQKRTAKPIADLQAEEGFAALIVTHDLGYAVAYGDDIGLLKAGRLEELAEATAFACEPKTPYGRALRDAAIALGSLEVSQ